jgi:periplasmic divalent cation tolerance protein
VSVIDKVNSFYWWEGKIEHTKEMLLIMKSEKSKFAEIEKIIKELHPYKTPEIVYCEIVGGHKNYLKWIEQCLK